MYVERVTEEQAATFHEQWVASNGTADCCSADNFSIWLSRDPASSWNKSAGRVFARDIMEKIQADPNNSRVRENLERHFYKRMKSIHRTYMEKKKPSHVQAQLKDIRAKRNRRALATSILIINIYEQLFKRRLTVCVRHSEMHRHVQIMKCLGSDGMSSDEPEPGMPQTHMTYRRKLLPWHSGSLMALLRLFDTIYQTDYRLQPDHTPTWGKMPRLREGHQACRSSDLKYVPGLPINAYDKGWILKRDHVFLRDKVKPTKEQYDFSLSAEMANLYVVSQTSGLILI
ncbi:uncharacterized protein EV420DRAFT_1279111 [Desarmillaria tabescens]|uniref:Uncharacterized protein n=1 Tax=Armillaria tabescens TaxID=1929756 RepID=A0AA39MMW7_ARMTA|nr:uncharacterized protein EV420DRAFT_1279111 [Desarmillaria tabescens]KAK0440671.1 hypothetical protein EV420DRAFT_1279111 [Desarmillaria tabescens]